MFVHFGFDHRERTWRSMLKGRLRTITHLNNASQLDATDTIGCSVKLLGKLVQ